MLILRIIILIIFTYMKKKKPLHKKLIQIIRIYLISFFRLIHPILPEDDNKKEIR